MSGIFTTRAHAHRKTPAPAHNMEDLTRRLAEREGNKKSKTAELADNFLEELRGATRPARPTLFDRETPMPERSLHKGRTSRRLPKLLRPTPEQAEPTDSGITRRLAEDESIFNTASFGCLILFIAFFFIGFKCFFRRSSAPGSNKADTTASEESQVANEAPEWV